MRNSGDFFPTFTRSFWQVGSSISLMMILLGFCWVQVAGQNPLRRGKLFVEWQDATTNKPIPKAQIGVYPMFEGKGYTLESDKKGRAGHMSLPEGVYRIVFSKEGYAPVEFTDVIIEDHHPARIYLKSLDAELAPYKKKQVRYQQPTLDIESSGLQMIIRN